MSTDMQILAEIKNNGKWFLLDYDDTGCCMSCWRSKMGSTYLIPLIFCKYPYVGFINIDKMPCMYKEPNGAPTDMSDELKIYANEVGQIAGYVSSEDIANFNWSFDVPYSGCCPKDQADEYYKTGKIPATFATAMGDRYQEIVDLEYTQPFVIPEIFAKEIEYLKSFGEDYRFVYYFF